MEKIARRMFCGTAMMAFPLLRLHAGAGEDVPLPADAVIDILADQITGITADGAQNGFKAEHFRRYAGLVRTFDAYLEQKGTNREFNDRLDDDDFYRVNPAFTAQVTAQYWQKHAIHFDENALAAQLTIGAAEYRELKRAIKRRGGVQTLHKAVAAAFDLKAKECEDKVIKIGATFGNPLRLPHRGKLPQPRFMPAQFQIPPDPSGAMPPDLAGIVPPDLAAVLASYGSSLDCLCKALLVEGSVLALFCAMAVCVPCCPIAAIAIALKNLLEAFHMCDANNC